MTNSIIYGQVDCYSKQYTNTGVASNVTKIVQDTYVQTFKFLEFLETKGITNLITYHSGSGGVGTGKNYVSNANAVGNNAFSVWRFNQYQDRNWEWYLYIHCMTGQNYQSVANAIPTRVDNGTTDINVATCGVVAQAAFSISGSNSINPWNGTISLSGTAYKSSPVWNSNSANYTAHVFPRVNNPSGSFSGSRDLCMVLRNHRALATRCYTRNHFLSDGHGILMINDSSTNAGAIADTNINSLSYIGPFRLNKSITDNSVGLTLGGTGSYGFCMFGTVKNNNESTTNGFGNSPANTIFENSSYGALSASIAQIQGGVFATQNMGVRVLRLSNDLTALGAGYYPNAFLPRNQLDEKMYSVYSTELTYSGFLGWLDTPLIRCFANFSNFTNDKANNGTRAVFTGDYVDDTNRRITVPWSGSAPGTGYSIDGRMLEFTSSY